MSIYELAECIKPSSSNTIKWVKSLTN